MTNERTDTGVPFVSKDADESAIWDALIELPQEEPSRQLRQRFYDRLDDRARPLGWVARVGGWLGIASPVGWMSAAATLLLGIVIGQVLEGESEASVRALQAQVVSLNRDLILDRLESDSPSKRLRGVVDALAVVERDAEIAHALLQTATDDSVHAVRSAAIDALGPQLRSPAIGEPLMRVLEASASPLVQLALVDLVLRHGTRSQIAQLIDLARAERLHPDLVEHVFASVSGERA